MSGSRPADSGEAYAPAEIAARVESMGVAKARMPLLRMAVLGVLAGAFIGLGAMFSLLVLADAGLGFALQRIGAGLCFSLGLLMVVVAGAELFTGNNLLAMAWAARQISTAELLRNWVVVCSANFAGAAGLALVVYFTGFWQMNGGAVGKTLVAMVQHKADLSPWAAFWRGVLCNVLVCLAVWMAMGGRSLVDKAVAVVPPVAAFVAAGFEHSIANMFYFPLAQLIGLETGMAAPGTAALFANLAVVIPGNLLGGSGLVALVYWVAYLRKPVEPR